MLLRFTNTAILALLVVLTLTGIYGIVWTLAGWPYEVHRIAAWALIALIPWKVGISWRSLKRGLQPRFDRSVLIVISVLLAAATLSVLGLGLVWAWNVGPWVFAFRQSAISLHWILALVIVPPFLLHAWRRWPRPKRTDFTSRRAFLQMLGLGAVGVVGWWLAGLLAGARAAAESPRRFSGSRERRSFSGNDFPVTNNAGEGYVRLDTQSWALALTGAVERPLTLTYEQLLDMPSSEVTATIDCTTGWYSTQVWRGVRLADLLDHARMRSEAGSVRIIAVSGYLSDFTLGEVGEILLATHVGGEGLDHWHGFPVRAVVPSRRGWFWVKWLTGVEVLTGPRAAMPDLSAPRLTAQTPALLRHSG
jgi:DMSO/TMAO reductase YedYZ molybdopterin-dependent catalytic subunit